MRSFLILLAEGEAGPAGQLTKDTSEFVNTVLGFLKTKGVDFAINIGASLAIFLIGKWVARRIANSVSRMMKKGNVDETLSKFLGNLIYMGLFVFVALAALGRLGVETTSFAALIAAAGLAIGFALQGSLGNFASGVMLILFKPFKVGDMINAGGSLGVVEEVGIFTTTMKTGDNVQIIVPNAAITSGTISNFTANGLRRVDMVMGCGYGDDMLEVKKTLQEILDNAPDMVLKDPAPTVGLAALADCSVNFNVRPWAKPEDYWAVWSYVHEQVKLVFDAKGYNIPFPQQDIHIQAMPGTKAA